MDHAVAHRVGLLHTFSRISKLGHWLHVLCLSQYFGWNHWGMYWITNPLLQYSSRWILIKRVVATGDQTSCSILGSGYGRVHTMPWTVLSAVCIVSHEHVCWRLIVRLFRNLGGSVLTPLCWNISCISSVLTSEWLMMLMPLIYFQCGFPIL